MIKEKLIIALDVATLKEEERLLDILSPYIRVFKIGIELFYSCGPKAIEIVKKYNRDIFLDLKFHDIPNTVKKSAKIVTRLGVFMFTVHAQGGYSMMRSALKGAEEESEILGIDRPIILGVTVLTSMALNELQQIGIDKSPEEEVFNLAGLSKNAGLDGIIASPQETRTVKKKIGKDFLIVTPGIRPKAVEKNDQKRTATPEQAFSRGADYIVVGRPITRAKDPLKALQGIQTN